MKRITQSIEYEGREQDSKLRSALRSWHSNFPFKSGIDWQFQYYWADLEDEDCLLFCLAHPEYKERFKNV